MHRTHHMLVYVFYLIHSDPNDEKVVEAMKRNILNAIYVAEIKAMEIITFTRFEPDNMVRRASKQ